jgi:hypothetical protein
MKVRVSQWRQRIWRSLSDYDPDQSKSCRFTERILTTSATLKQQERNIVEYVVAAIQAHRISLSAPSLLPMDQLFLEAA